MTNLGDDLNQAAGTPEPELDVAALQARAGGRARVKRRALASGACVVLLLAGGVAWAGSQSGGGSKQQLTAGEGAGEGGEAATTTSVVINDTTTLMPSTSAPPTTIIEDPGATTTVVGPLATTPPSADTTIPPTTTVPAAPKAITISGSYTGKERYRLSSPECPSGDTTHALVTVMTVEHRAGRPIAPGPLQFKQDYCGHITGDTWHGTGTFGLSFPDGDMVSGVVDHEAPNGTDGIPYQVTITGGTGAYEGATGACDFTVHITNKALGSQDHHGTFTCEIRLAGGPSASMGTSAPTTIPVK